MSVVDYALLQEQLLSLAAEDAWFLPLLSNASALLCQTLPDVNWAGFYLVRGSRLTLGPFQGKTACIHIPFGRGVCGAAWRDNETKRVDDVHRFPGHIACDGASNAEIVIPLRAGDRVAAVLDIDSPLFDRFTEEDQRGLERFARLLEENISWEDTP